MTNSTYVTDELGPEKILFVHDAKTGMKGVVVVDSTVNSMAGGGIRMMPDITIEEIFDLARSMTYKFSVLNFPIGGAKAGIWSDPHISQEKREAILTSFGNAIKPLLASGITLGADIGTNDEDIEIVYKGAELPSKSKGILKEKIEGEPLENLATGFGVATATKAACEIADLEINKTSAAIEGFGKVGGGVARFLEEAGVTIKAISTFEGTLYNPNGLNVSKLFEMRYKFGDKLVMKYENGQHLNKEEIYGLPVDILIPGARPYVINKNNVHQVQAKIISCIANLPITAEAEEILFQKGIYSVPDFVANSGGVICGVIDVFGGTSDDVFKVIERLLYPLIHKIMIKSKENNSYPKKYILEKTRQKIVKMRQSNYAPSFVKILKKLNLSKSKTVLSSKKSSPSNKAYKSL